MRLFFIKLFAVVFTSAIALKLFLFGVAYPLDVRIRGDALEYLRIADGFRDFKAALNFVGGRTVGFPLFEYTIHQLISIFLPTVFVLLWINTIGAFMLLIHITSAWLFSAWAQSNKFIEADCTRYLLFFYLATFPSLVGHTTSPITDTFSVDITMLGLFALNRSLHARNLYVRILFSCISAIFFSYSILVRPASLIGLSVAMVVCCGISMWGARNSRIVFGVTLIGCATVLIPCLLNCSQRYGSYCLQAPTTFNTNSSIQDGLRGARVMWTLPNNYPGTIPILSDNIMITNYYRECNITSLIGMDDNTFSGCLVARPLTLPAFIFKKWVGLFDHFRFTPYLENLTPLWLRDLSRFYCALAWMGLSLCFIAAFQLQSRSVRPDISRLWTNNLGVVFLGTYSLIMLAQHTALHTEERYGFPLLPLCTAVVFMYGERSIAQYRARGWRSLVWLMFFCSFTLALFLAQISAWDYLSFPAVN